MNLCHHEHMPPDGDATQAATSARLRLADAVKSRRQELGLSVRGAAENGGLARGTWIALEEGSRKTADNNYAGIERALHWTPGSVVATLAGGNPTNLDPHTTLTVTPAATTVGAGAATAEVHEEEALVKVMRSNLPDEQKRALVQMLIAERAAAEKARAERAQQMIELMGGQA